jgi:hypothetical protein
MYRHGVNTHMMNPIKTGVNALFVKPPWLQSDLHSLITGSGQKRQSPGGQD